MSKVKEIMEQADGLSRALFAEYKTGKSALEQAESRLKECPAGAQDRVIWQGKVQERKQELQEIERKFETLLIKLQSMRKDVILAMEQENFADPKKIDRDVLYLLDSGILSPAEYKKLYEESAGNPTMQRIIRKRVESLADDQIGKTDIESMQIRSLYYSMKQNENDQTGDYDVLLNLFERIITNKSMIDHWDEFVEIGDEE